MEYQMSARETRHSVSANIYPVANPCAVARSRGLGMDHRPGTYAPGVFMLPPAIARWFDGLALGDLRGPESAPLKREAPNDRCVWPNLEKNSLLRKRPKRKDYERGT